MHFSNDDKVTTKLICYIQSTPSIHQLPPVYPDTILSPEEFQKYKYRIVDLIYEKVIIIISYILPRYNIYVP